MYRYRLIMDGDTGVWTLTDLTSVKVNNLAPANYVFQSCARSQNTGWGNPSEYSFAIRPRFIDRWWVRGVILVFSSLFIYLVFRIREIRLKKVSQLALAFKELELQNAQLQSLYVLITNE